MLKPQTTVRLALLCAALLAGAAAPKKSEPGQPVVLRAQPGTPLDATARKLVADDLAASRSRRDNPLVVVGTADLGGDRPAVFVQLQSEQQCGSAGCSTSVYAWERGAWKRVLDGTTGRLKVAAKRTKGHADLITDAERFVWTGSAYRSTEPVPALDLRPRPARPGRH